MSPATLELALRAASVAMLLVLTVALLRDVGHTPGGRLAAGFALGSVAHTLTLGIGTAQALAAWHPPLIALSTGNVVVFWLFTQALFDDAFRLRPWHGLVWAAVAAFSLANCTWIAGRAGAQGAVVTVNLIVLAFIVLAIWQTIASWTADLVEGRRRLRLFIALATALYGGLNALLQILLSGGGDAGIAAVANAVMLAGIVAAISVQMLRVDATDLFPAMERPREPRAAEPVAPAVEPAAADQRLVDALMRMMADERIYRQDSLTIGGLAVRLGTPEDRLRRLINQQLGYRNFNAFLNVHRIAEAKAALADPAQREVPVTTIALDAGFQSLGPFNRAFKALTGVTPSEYRRRNVPAG